MKENYLVTCGKWTTTESVDREIFENHEAACFEAATMSFEKYFKTTGPSYASCQWQYSCVVRPAKTPNNRNDYLIWPFKLYENIGLHVVDEYYKKNKQL